MVSSKAGAIQMRTRKLKPGMVLNKAVHSRDGSRLFPEKKELTADDIRKLENWNIRVVYVEPDKENAEEARKVS